LGPGSGELTEVNSLQCVKRNCVVYYRPPQVAGQLASFGKGSQNGGECDHSQSPAVEEGPGKGLLSWSIGTLE
jgi:hypothetical protein